MRPAGPANHLAVLASVFVMWSLAACSESGQSSVYGYGGPRNVCVDSSDCVEGFCHGHRKVCVVAQQSSTELYARITFDSPILKPQLVRVPMASNDALPIEIQEPVVIDMLRNPIEIDADILFFDLSNTLPGDDPDVSVYKTYLDPSTTAATPDALFSLLPGTYDITVYPVGESKATYPVAMFNDIRIDSEGIAWDGDSQLESISPESAATITGNTANTLTGEVYFFSTVEENIEARDLTVQAYALDSGRVLSHAFEVFCATDSGPSGPTDCGNFSIPLPLDAESVTLRFFKPAEPSFPAYVVEKEDLAFTGGVLKEQIVLPPLETPVMVTGKISVNPVPDGISPPPLCRVLFEMIDDDMRTLDYWVYTNGYGEIERADGLTGVYLYPGRYRVSVFPMTNKSTLSQTYAQTTLSETLVVINPQNAESVAEEENITVNQFSLQLMSRISVSGTVTYNGAAIPGTALTAYNIEELHPFNNQLTTRTRATGEFDIWVDNTPYYAITNPPSASGFATGFHIWNIPRAKEFVFAAEVQVPFVVEGTFSISRRSSWFKDIEPGDIVMEWYRQFGQSAYRVHRNRVSEGYFYSALLPPN